MSPWKVILATMIIFGCGVVTGGLVVRVKTAHPRVARVDQFGHPVSGAKNAVAAPGAPPWQLQRKEFLDKMDRQLDLTPEQRQKIDKVMHDSLDRTRPLWQQIAPQMRDEMRRVREEIRKELTPEQQKKFNDLLKPHPNRKDGTNAPPRVTATN
ncbi:MAG: Spy/CpxP family protein refolding chaperone [Limisphaerales bacterium]